MLEKNIKRKGVCIRWKSSFNFRPNWTTVVPDIASKALCLLPLQSQLLHSDITNSFWDLVLFCMFFLLLILCTIIVSDRHPIDIPSQEMTLKMQKRSIMRDSNYDYQHHSQLLLRNSVQHCKRSPLLKRIYFSVISSIKKTIQKRHRRLIEFFSKLEGARRRGKGFVILHREEAGGFQSDSSPRLQLEFKDDVDLPNILALREKIRPGCFLRYLQAKREPSFSIWTRP